MVKRIIITLLIILVLVGSLIFSLPYNLTGKTVDSFTYSYTKAVCNSTNYCQDYEIKCKDNEILSMSPITGSAIQLISSWKDPRTKEDIERLC